MLYPVFVGNSICPTFGLNCVDLVLLRIHVGPALTVDPSIPYSLPKDVGWKLVACCSATQHDSSSAWMPADPERHRLLSNFTQSAPGWGIKIYISFVKIHDAIRKVLQGDNLPVNVPCPIINNTHMIPMVLRFMRYHLEGEMIVFHETQDAMMKRNKSNRQQFRCKMKQLHRESRWAYRITTIPKLLQERQ